MSVAPTSPSSRRRPWFHSVIYRPFTVSTALGFYQRHRQGKREIMGLMAVAVRSAKIVSNRLEDGSSLNFLSIGGRYSRSWGQFSVPDREANTGQITRARSKARSVARSGRLARTAQPSLIG